MPKRTAAIAALASPETPLRARVKRMVVFNGDSSGEEDENRGRQANKPKPSKAKIDHSSDEDDGHEALQLAPTMTPRTKARQQQQQQQQQQQVAPLQTNKDNEERKKKRLSILADKKKRRSTIMGAALATGSPLRDAGKNAGEVNAAVAKKLSVFQHLSEEEINKTYEEWMKIAADNKINTNNTWSMDLIDYFHDLSLLKEGDDINFQKASCTLDGCVKVYSSRVDSVSTETNKLLTGLASASEASEKAKRRGGDGEDDGGDGKADGPAASARRKKTLESTWEALDVKQYDLEFSVDPLFKKTTAEFDEGGASGLLLNHLQIDRNGRIIFDSSDAILDSKANSGPSASDAADVQVSVSSISGAFLASLQNIWSKEICPSFKDFEFNKPGEFNIPLPSRDAKEDEEAEEGRGPNDSVVASLDAELEAAIGAGHEDAGSDYYDHDAGHADDDDDGGGAAKPASLAGTSETKGGVRPEVVLGKAGSAQNDYSYFDQALGRNWAGPEHWRMRRLIQNQATKQAGAEGAARKKREKKEFVLDFLGGEAVDAKKLFAKGAPATLNLPKEKRATGANPLLVLPQDVRFSSKDLTKLFTKPMWALKFRAARGGASSRNATSGEADVDWDAAEGIHTFGAQGSQAPAAGDVTTNASAFYDDDDDDIGDMSYFQPQPVPAGADIGGELLAQPKFIKRVEISYAKTAKKVDVKKLKENLWKKLAEPVVSEGGRHAEPAEAVRGKKDFQEVIGTLADVYPEKKLRDISVPFCFICLLHLANEKGLSLENPGGSISNLIIAQK